MTHSYNITGMSCDGCRSKVEKALDNIDGIDAKVSLHPPVAAITMEKYFSIEQLQEALSAAGQYSITVGTCSDNASQAEATPGKKSCC